jgi:hypothetical protein
MDCRYDHLLFYITTVGGVMSIEAMKQALAKFEHLWEIGIDAEYKVELLPEIEALRQAIEQAEYDNLTVKFGERAKEYLEGAKKSWQEPVAWMYIEPDNEFKTVHIDDCDYSQFPNDEWFPVYTAPNMSTKPENIDTSAERVHETDKSVHDDDDIQEYKRPWVGLTDEEIVACGWCDLRFARAIEAKLRERNK